MIDCKFRVGDKVQWTDKYGIDCNGVVDEIDTSSSYPIKVNLYTKGKYASFLFDGREYITSKKPVLKLLIEENVVKNKYRIKCESFILSYQRILDENIGSDVFAVSEDNGDTVYVIRNTKTTRRLIDGFGDKTYYVINKSNRLFDKIDEIVAEINRDKMKVWHSVEVLV